MYYFRLEDVEVVQPRKASRQGLSSHLAQEMEMPDPHHFTEFVETYVSQFVSDSNFLIPLGIARNKALRENIFVMVCCVENRIPLGIIGEVRQNNTILHCVKWISCVNGHSILSLRLLQPGTSKTLSFHIVLANLRGPDSPKPFCRKFVALDPFFLLCSPTTTSNEVTLTFNRAIERNDRYEQSNTQRRVVVFVDEGKDE